MFIKELIVDGFKSYANRTVVSGWDAEFNAITGFNGTGKSNMLDAICFVLGISNLAQVRVHGLQELVYKQGQSRVSRASVTIVFDNRATAKSPIGYESCAEITVTRQVVIGGRNKYLINGHTAQLQRVQNLFHSVGLNVNNPHFLIMQGRITKVCNMKPLETLGMIEEAAGTKMFEQKKQAAQKTILKKQQKVDEIERIMEKEIQPVLDNLRLEKQNFYRYNANRNEIETLQRLCDAMQYHNAGLKSAALLGDIEQAQSNLSSLEAEQEGAANALQAKQRMHGEVVLQREKDFLKNEAYLALETQGNKYSKDLVTADAEWKNEQATLVEEQKEAKKVEKSVEASAKTVAAKAKEHASSEEKLLAISGENKRITEDIAHIKSAQLGIDVGGGEGQEGQGGLAGQLMGLQKQLANEEGSTKSAMTKLKHSTAVLKEQTKKLKDAEKSGDGAAKALAAKTEAIATLTATLAKMGADGPTAGTKKAKLEARVTALRDECAALQYEADALNAKLGSRLKFDYNARAAGLDAGKVKGLVASLVKVPQVEHTTAVEIIAGAKLYNVVVDTEATGKALLEKGQLKKRVTIIPLNKITPRTVQANVVAKAQALGGGPGNVQLGLSVVGYDAELSAAMAYIFGSAFVVNDSTAATKLAFHPEVRTKCVTLDGDVYDPSGTLEGGALPSGPSVLTQLLQLNEVHASLATKTAEHKVASGELSELVKSERTASEMRGKLEILEIELKALKERQAQSEHFSLIQAVENGNKEVQDLETTLAGADGRKKDLKTRIAALETMLREFEGERARSTEQMEARLSGLQKELVSSNKKLAEAQKKTSMLAIELQELKEEHAALEAALAKVLEEVKATGLSITRLEGVVEERRAVFDEFDATLRKEKEKFAGLDTKLAKLTKEMASLSKAQADASLEAKKVHNAVTRLQGERADVIKTQVRLEKDLEWIKGEKHLFGQTGGDYDFAKSAGSGARLQALQAEQDSLSKKINKKVMGMFEKAESEAADLNKKRAIILEDKAQIEHVIAELDIEKTRTLESTWHTVSESFGTIFSTLLPGVSAKLSPADGAKSVMDGLDIKVAFGGIEKESLSELSGGQRSLLALSLILALLKFKPAPMYILDEIDAALDLSHTQNIGQVLKKHFSESQFIVVSLKEGMFNNANVLFRTKFVDGVSAVVRTAMAKK